MIRRATLDDIPRILEITRQTIPLLRANGNPQWSDTYPARKDYEQDIALGGLFVYDDQGVQGFVSVAPDDSEIMLMQPFTPCHKPITLHRTAVAPEARGKGIGRALFLAAYQQALAQGCDMIRTDTHETNLTMNALMMRMGYRFISYFPREGWSGRFMAYERRVNPNEELLV